MISYNHAAFIAEALDSIVSQETAFDIEVVIGDDCSKDNTREIISRYAATYPFIKPVFHKVNVGMNANFVTVLMQCRGDYVAVLEGDDYWTDPGKLQSQVSFLNDHPECVLCHHRVSHVETSSGKVAQEFPPRDRRLPVCSPLLLTHGNFIQTCTLMFRRDAMPVFDDEYFKLKLGDWPLCAKLGEKGLIGYIDRNMAVYRLHAGGAWSARNDEFRYEATLQMCRYLTNHFHGESRRAWIEAQLFYRYCLVTNAVCSPISRDFVRRVILLLRDTATLDWRQVPLMTFRCARVVARRLTGRKISLLGVMILG